MSHFCFCNGRVVDILKRESKFQSELIKEIKKLYPGCIILKNDCNYLQGIPDLLVLYKKYWAALECKNCEEASHRPNQDYYVKKMNDMSYASFVYPENKEEVLDGLRKAFRDRRKPRVPKRLKVSLD